MSETALMNAKLSESMERYEEMAKYMKVFIQGLPCVVDDKVNLEPEHRNLLSVAYKNVVGTRRSAWRVMSSMEQKSTPDIDSEVLKKYKVTIVNELKSICEDVIKLLNDKLIIEDDDDGEIHDSESFIFFMKMKGDYYRYLCEVTEDKPDKEQLVEQSSKAYNGAYTKAKKVLASTHPIRLGLALNYSVFHYEIANASSKACSLAKAAFDDAIAELDNLQEDSYKDSTLIMQLLRDNLTLWTAGEQEPEGEEEN